MVNRDLKHLAAGGKSRSATRKKSGATGRSKKKPMPGWLWLLIGLMGGLVIAAVIYFGLGDGGESVVRPGAADSDTAPPAVANKAVVPASPPAEEAASQERFEFYHLLSRLEVIIPDKEIKEMQEQIAPKEDVSYIIQAGSFHRYEEADSVKAQLALLGIEADVQKVQSKGVDWYRVRIGPFASSRKLNKVRNRIHAADINTMVVKIRKEE